MAGIDKDEIPVLHDIVRPGTGEPDERQERTEGTASLTESEIEAIATRVIERYSEHLEQAVARAIASALQAKGRTQGQRDDDKGEG